MLPLGAPVVVEVEERKSKGEQIGNCVLCFRVDWSLGTYPAPVKPNLSRSLLPLCIGEAGWRFPPSIGRNLRLSLLSSTVIYKASHCHYIQLNFRLPLFSRPQHWQHSLTAAVRASLRFLWIFSLGIYLYVHTALARYYCTYARQACASCCAYVQYLPSRNASSPRQRGRQRTFRRLA